jgi:CRISPR-associated endoribonuclease Cas6
LREIGGAFRIPIHYNHILQSFIYDNISSELSSFLHEQGYVHGKRSFKLFTFSRLYGKFRLNRRSINFEPPIRLYIASSDTHFIQEFAESLIKAENVRLGTEVIRISSIEVQSNQKFNREIIINTLAPITVYSTLNTRDRKKKTYYYSPYEKEFSTLIADNLRKKFNLVYHKEPREHTLTIELANEKKVSEKIIKYKGTIIKGWMGKFKVRGSPTLISIAYDTGLDSKNSQGFGMFEIIENNK